MARKSSGPRIAASTLIDVARVSGISPGAPTQPRSAAQASGRGRLVEIFLPSIVNSIFADTVPAFTDRLADAARIDRRRAAATEALLEGLLARIAEPASACQSARLDMGARAISR